MDTSGKTTTTILPTVQSKSDFWAAWVLANWIASLAARWVLDAFRTYDQLSGSHIPAPFNGLAAGAAIGVVAGIFQWLMLRRQVYQTTKWAIATFLGWTGGMLIGWPLLVSIDGVLGEITAFGLVGLTIGFLQWLTLRKQVYRAGWWIPASGLAWATGLYIIGWVIAGFVFVRLWTRPKQKLPVMPGVVRITDTTMVPAKSKPLPSRLRRDSVLVAQWIGLSILSTYVFFFVSASLTFVFIFLSTFPLLRVLIVAVAWMIVGMFNGIMQGLVLQKRIPQLKQWILFTSLGWGISGAFIGFFIPTVRGTSPAPADSIIAGAVVGLLLGAMQWLVLHKYVNKATLWIVANVIGGALGMNSGLPIVGLFIITISIITGPLLVWLLRHPIQRSHG